MEEERGCELGWIMMCRSCKLNGRDYHHGSEVVEPARVLQCSNGVWKERDNTFGAAGV